MLKLIPVVLAVFVLGCAHAGPDRAAGEKAEIRLDLAERYLMEGEARLAMEQLKVVREVSPEDPRLHFNLGLVKTFLEDWDRAAGSFEKVLELRPGCGEAWNNLGQVREAQGRLARARQAYEQALAQDDYMTPEFAAHNMASLYNEKGDQQQAMAYAKLAVDHNRRFVPGYELAGSIYQDKGHHLKALQVFETGVRARPDSLQLTFLLAEEMVRAGRIREARQYFERVIELNDASTEAQKARYYLEALR